MKLPWRGGRPRKHPPPLNLRCRAIVGSGGGLEPDGTGPGADPGQGMSAECYGADAG